MKIKIIIIFIFSACVFNAFALSIIELRCSYTVKGFHKEMEVSKDSDGITRWSGQPKENKYNDKGVSYIKITSDDKNYFKYESGKTIYSTKDGESVFNGWIKNEIDVKVNNASDENLIFITANMYSKKYGEMRVFDKIKIDRISGDYQSISEANDTMGKVEKNEKINFITTSSSFFESKGNCEKFDRKF